MGNIFSAVAYFEINTRNERFMHKTVLARRRIKNRTGAQIKRMFLTSMWWRSVGLRWGSLRGATVIWIGTRWITIATVSVHGTTARSWRWKGILGIGGARRGHWHRLGAFLFRARLDLTYYRLGIYSTPVEVTFVSEQVLGVMLPECVSGTRRGAYAQHSRYVFPCFVFGHLKVGKRQWREDREILGRYRVFRGTIIQLVQYFC